MRILITFFLLLACGTIQAQVDTNAKPEIFHIVEKMPLYPGGDLALFTFLKETISYPPMERENDIQGKVIVRFIIDENGKVVEPQILRGISPGLDKEALRVVSLLPNFKPGTQQGVPVKVYYNLPISFKLVTDNIENENDKDVYSPRITSEPDYGKASNAFYYKDYKTAIKYYNKIIKKYPDNFEGYLCAGLALKKDGNKEKACKMFNEAIQRGSKEAAIEKKNNCN